MVRALARLRDKGLVRMEMLATGGRPSECWSPREQTTNVVLTAPGNKQISSTAVPSLARPDLPVQTPTSKEDGSFVRSPASIKSVADLFAAVKAINGRLCWQNDKIGVDAPSEPVTPEILAAVTALEAELLPFMLPRPQPAEATDPENVLDESDPWVKEVRLRLEES